MTFHFRPAASFNERHGLFVALVGGTNSGKTFSALRLARGIAGPSGRIAVVDTEGGRTLHLKQHFAFDAHVMDPPFRPERFAEAARAAEEAKYDALLIDSFSMVWRGIGGVLDWQEAELDRMAGDDMAKRERVKMAAWIKPKGAHKAMVYSLLQRRIPIIFAIRGEESVKPGSGRGDKPVTVFKPVCSQPFLFEVTVSFRLGADRKGYIDLSDPSGWKMEGDHRAIFRDGDLISEDHGRQLAEWARGNAPTAGKAPPARDVLAEARSAAAGGREAFGVFWKALSQDDRHAIKPHLDQLREIADEADRPVPADEPVEDPFGPPPGRDEAPPAAAEPEPEPEPEEPPADDEPADAAPSRPPQEWSKVAQELIDYLDGAQSARDLQVRMASGRAQCLRDMQREAHQQFLAVMGFATDKQNELRNKEADNGA